MRRRDLIAFIVGGAAAPIAGWAQHKAMPMIGFLNSASPGPLAKQVEAFQEGLRDSGYALGRDVAIEYRWAEGDYNRLPALAAELIARKVDLIATSGGPSSAKAAKEVTSTVPIVFIVGTDPVELGLVATLSRHRSNLTGVSMLSSELNPKRLELLSELVPKAKVFALLVNPGYAGTALIVREIEEAARVRGVEIRILRAGTEGEIEAAFAKLNQLLATALVVANDPFFNSRVDQIAALASRHAIPAIYAFRLFTPAGGLISYGTGLSAVYRQAGTLVGKILNGAKPSDLPIQQPNTFELTINLKTAKALGLTVPQALLARADEVLE